MGAAVSEAGAIPILHSRAAMNPEQLQRLLDRLVDVRNTDELFDLERTYGPIDEDDALGRHALFELASVRCQLARGPAPSLEGFTLTRPAPACAKEIFEVRGRTGSRIVRVGWADGRLFGSLHVLRRLECGDASFVDAAGAQRQIRGMFDVVLDEVRTLAVA